MNIDIVAHLRGFSVRGDNKPSPDSHVVRTVTGLRRLRLFEANSQRLSRLNCSNVIEQIDEQLSRSSLDP